MAESLRHVAAQHAKKDHRQQARHGQVGAEADQAEYSSVKIDHDATPVVGPVTAVEHLGDDQGGPGNGSQGLPMDQRARGDLEDRPPEQGTYHHDMCGPEKDIQHPHPGWTAVLSPGNRVLIFHSASLPGRKKRDPLTIY
jgi:hypothetical protein